MEQWRAVVGYEGFYEVSDMGRVRSISRSITDKNGKEYVRDGRVLADVRRRGYPVVQLSVENEGKCLLVHRLVLEAFVGPCPESMEGCHNNGDRGDNVLSNLRWDTRQNNILDSVEHGTHVHARKTECDEGHPLEGENLYINATSGQRVCKLCQRNYMREYMRERRAAAKAAKAVDST